MDDARQALSLNLVDAKAHACSVVDAYVARHPKVHAENVRKAKAAIERASSLNRLAATLANFVLAHPSEGLKVLR
jgi:hypothetical protein